MVPTSDSELEKPALGSTSDLAEHSTALEVKKFANNILKAREDGDLNRIMMQTVLTP